MEVLFFQWLLVHNYAKKGANLSKPKQLALRVTNIKFPLTVLTLNQEGR